MPEYERFRDLLRPLTMPVYVIPGNHDDRVHLRDVFGTQGTKPMAGFVQYVVDEWPVRLIALDTNVPGQPGGYLCAERLRWLEERLAEAPARPTMIFLHHPPFPTGLPFFDHMGFEGAEACRVPTVPMEYLLHHGLGLPRLVAASMPPARSAPHWGDPG